MTATTTIVITKTASSSSSRRRYRYRMLQEGLNTWASNGMSRKKLPSKHSNLTPWFMSFRSEREMRWEASIMMRPLTSHSRGRGEEIHGMRKREQGKVE